MNINIIKHGYEYTSQRDRGGEKRERWERGEGVARIEWIYICIIYSDKDSLSLIIGEHYYIGLRHTTYNFIRKCLVKPRVFRF